jgi:hypothetical protein
LQSLFQATDIAANALKECCEQFAVQDVASKQSKLKKSKSAKAQANEIIQTLPDASLDNVIAVVQSLEEKWKKSHSKVSNETVYSTM